MGRHASRETTANYHKLEMRYLRRNALLTPGRESTIKWLHGSEESGSIGIGARQSAVVLKYRHQRYGCDWQTVEYSVSIERTDCRYGGQRPWFRCPGAGCGRRVAVLYGGNIFACRHCHNLSYESQREQPWNRALKRTQKIHQKLGGSGCIADGTPPKPKGMHWRTYSRLAAQMETADAQAMPPFLFRALGWLHPRDGQRF